MADNPNPKRRKIGEGSFSSSTCSMETGVVDSDFESMVKALVEEILKGQKADSGGATLGDPAPALLGRSLVVAPVVAVARVRVLAALLQLVCE